MSTIQWYPGHMNSARTKAAETMEITDLVIEVVDARLPLASSNPMVEEMRLHRQRPCLKILNKADLADSATTKLWLDYLNAQKNTRAIAMNTKNPGMVSQILPSCRKLAPHRNDPTKPLRMMIMGVPNVGKSTLMNALLKKRVANVGDEPAVTKTQQRLLLGNDMVLTDTPGMLWPKIALESDGLMLAASHAVGVNAYYEDEVAQFIAGILRILYAPNLIKRYSIKNFDELDDVGIIEHIAKQRGYRLKGGDLDFEKAAHTLLLDYRSGSLGGITLETPDSRAAALIENAILEKEKSDAKAAKEAARNAHLEGNRRGKSNATDANQK
jgi:ribosome biogenesis GTPase A